MSKLDNKSKSPQLNWFDYDPVFYILKKEVSQDLNKKRLVYIEGFAASGKTAMINQYLSLIRKSYPGGVFYFDNLLPQRKAELEVEKNPNEKLVVIDNLMPIETEIQRKFFEIIKNVPKIHVLFVANEFLRKELSDFYRVCDLVIDARSWWNPADFEWPGLVDKHGKPLSQSDRCFNQIKQDISLTNDKLLRDIARNPRLIYSVSPRKFEEIVAELLTKQGYDISLTNVSRDGGFDMYAAHRTGIGTFLYLVECKRYSETKKVGIDVIRSLYGVVQQKNVTAGIVVTSSLFTLSAKTFTESIKYQMKLNDYYKVKEWLKYYLNKFK